MIQKVSKNQENAPFNPQKSDRFDDESFSLFHKYSKKGFVIELHEFIEFLVFRIAENLSSRLSQDKLDEEALTFLRFIQWGN